jgi:hypothetical protein
MDRLSTELDANIIQCLAGSKISALSALSKTSKYYRSIAEPHLYRDLTFSIKRYVDLVLLFDTVLNRRELARHIHSFTLNDAEYSDIPQGSAEIFSGRMWKSFGCLKQAIDELVPPSSRTLAMMWLRRALVDAPIVDGQLAAILCLAQNIEHL